MLGEPLCFQEPQLLGEIQTLSADKVSFDGEIHGQAGAPHLGGHFYGDSGPARTVTEHLRADGPGLCLPAPPHPDTHKPVPLLHNNQRVPSSLVTPPAVTRPALATTGSAGLLTATAELLCAGLGAQSPAPISTTPAHC